MGSSRPTAGTQCGSAVLVVLGVVACGGATASPGAVDGGGHDGQVGQDAAADAAVADAGPDASYLACFSASGQLDASLKACQSDGDCLVKQEQTDCCGTILYVGVNAMYAGSFAECEAAWVAHFPGCGCASNQTRTEDGKSSTFGSDAAAPQVHCTDFTMSGGICLSYAP